MLRAVAAVLALTLAGAAAAQSAADLAPDVLARNITDEVLQVLRADKDIQSGNMKKAIDLVETKVLPHFDFTRMTQLAMGRNWRDTTPEQKKALTQEFRDLLVRTYTVALTQYRTQTVDYKPLKLNPGDTEVVVRSQINNPGAAPIAVDYAMSKAPNGWKVFDIAVENVSLVQNYRTTFNTEVQKSGVDGLIKVLADRNKALAARQ
jgi:phospholipid transport system substrate-binding protein